MLCRSVLPWISALGQPGRTCSHTAVCLEHALRLSGNEECRGDSSTQEALRRDEQSVLGWGEGAAVPRALRCRGSGAIPSGIRGALGEAWSWQHSLQSWHGTVCATPAEDCPWISLMLVELVCPPHLLCRARDVAHGTDF